MKKLVVLAVPTLCLVAAAGCNRDRTGTVTGSGDLDRDRSGSTTVTGANVGSVGNDSAIDRIVAARCAREAACNNVGADKHYSSREVCTRDIRADMRDDLSAKDCPRGIDQKELGECLEAIQKEDCNNPIDDVGRLIACRTSDLCLSTDMPNR